MPDEEAFEAETDASESETEPQEVADSEESKEQEEKSEEQAIGKIINEHIQFRGHAGVKIEYNGRVTCIDPYNLSDSDAENVDYVFLTKKND